MTDKQIAALLVSCRADLRKTLEGYVSHPDGPWWSKAMPKLDKAIRELTKAPVPALGPVLEGDKAMLLYVPTHKTDDIPLDKGIYIAFDAGFNERGRKIIAPEALTITSQSGAAGGDAVYATGVSKIKYWIGHIGVAPATGTKFLKGAVIARIADQSGTDHVHWGLDTRPLTGEILKWGRDGNGPQYSYGSPTIGVQLGRMLS